MIKNNNLIIQSGYKKLLTGIADLLQLGRKASAHAINNILTSVYWEIGRRIVLFEQSGNKRAPYGEKLLIKLSHDLSAKFGKGFSVRNL